VSRAYWRSRHSGRTIRKIAAPAFRSDSAPAFPQKSGVKGGEWECGAAGRVQSTLVEKRDGDIFGLAKTVPVPFVLPRDKTSIDQLLARMPGRT